MNENEISVHGGHQGGEAIAGIIYSRARSADKADRETPCTGLTNNPQRTELADRSDHWVPHGGVGIVW